jgi:mono/diheme cytochrome c family protein
MATLSTGSRRSAPSLTCMRTSAAALGVALFISAPVLLVERAQAQAPPQRTEQHTAASPSGLGRSPTQAELRTWDLSVGPDGAELPPGNGDAVRGAVVFMQRGCASCHGPTGTEGPAPVLVGGKATLSTNYFPIRYWPFAPPVWDYINRAMPYDRPGHLTHDEVYALVAYLLFKNDIIKETDRMDASTLPKVQMPHRAEYKGPSPAKWTPDTPRGFKILP